MKKPELLAPAGDLERLKIALKYGADAVYIGGPSLNLRANAINFTLDEIKDILKIGGKIWIYYDKDTPVCSVFYIPTSNKSLRKHNVEYDEKITGSLGPIMVRKEYVGNGLQTAMLEVLNIYVQSIGKTHMFTKAHSDNI